MCGIPNCETKNKWISTLRGRFGYAADRVLFYATAGGAFGDIVVNTLPTWQSTSKAARIEYLFVDFSNASFTPAVGVPLTVKLNENLIRVGVDYKFR